jgi:hypothetical protein
MSNSLARAARMFPCAPVTAARLRRTLLGGAVIGAALIAPAATDAHSLNATYQSRLPLVVYLAGAALTVALSFAFLLLADVRSEAPPRRGGSVPPTWVRYPLRAIGLIGWIWIVVQGIAGGTSAGDVSTLFLWVYGWVGVAMLSALVGPVWNWLDPFATLFDIGAAIVRRFDVATWDAADYPRSLGRWPAVIGLAFFVWLELVADVAGSSTLFVVLVGYTAFTLAMMAQFGRDAWRRDGETFSVWFGLLNRIAPIGLGDDRHTVVRRPFASGLLEPGWQVADIVLVAIGVASILYDGLSQTTTWFSVFGVPSIPAETLELLGFVGLIVAAALLVGRLVGIEATGAGLLPIAAGYLIAHYFTYLFIDGQRIVVALADPLQQGTDLGGFGWAFFEPNASWFPPGLVWTVQIAAVVGGHMLGAWGGHVVAARNQAPKQRTHRRREIPLAVIMVALTTLTLWSLGQALIVEAPSDGTASVMVGSLARDG